MTIAPVVRTVEVKAPPARAFELFTASMGRWWPAGKTIGANPHVDIVVEPREGGRWYERDAEGAETDWGRVLLWDPPARLVLGWQLNARFAYDPDMLTEVELGFEPLAGGGTRVRLEHRNLERYGEDAPRIATMVDGGWGDVLAHFADCPEQQG